jgi:hypothetical protein
MFSQLTEIHEDSHDGDSGRTTLHGYAGHEPDGNPQRGGHDEPADEQFSEHSLLSPFFG